jgi:5-(carboxyamino)imidazole ribonucleotide synthase
VARSCKPSAESSVLLPGTALGVLGGGQLGAMFAMAARRMGYRVEVISDSGQVPAARHADRVHEVAYDDIGRLTEIAAGLDAVTFEFENVPAEAAAAIEAVTRLRPSAEVLATTQDRGTEKAFLVEHGFDCVPHRVVESAADLAAAVEEVGLPAVVKTCRFGYDGHGQRRLTAAADAAAAWESLGGGRLVVEAWLDYTCELSVIVARGADGATAAFAPAANTHANHILDISAAPAAVPAEVAIAAERIAGGVAAALDLVGVVCVEFFLARDGRLLVNEIAPRPHNSGHLTIEAAATSQFEQQLRALCGLPLGSSRSLAPAAMANLLGDLWAGGEPDWAAAVGVSGVRLHLYGKGPPRPGRKMGHLTACGATLDEAIASVLAARRLAARD